MKLLKNGTHNYKELCTQNMHNIYNVCVFLTNETISILVQKIFIPIYQIVGCKK